MNKYTYNQSGFLPIHVLITGLLVVAIIAGGYFGVKQLIAPSVQADLSLTWAKFEAMLTNDKNDADNQEAEAVKEEITGDDKEIEEILEK